MLLFQEQFHDTKNRQTDKKDRKEIAKNNTCYCDTLPCNANTLTFRRRLQKSLSVFFSITWKPSGAHSRHCYSVVNTPQWS